MIAALLSDERFLLLETNSLLWFLHVQGNAGKHQVRLRKKKEDVAEGTMRSSSRNLRASIRLQIFRSQGVRFGSRYRAIRVCVAERSIGEVSQRLRNDSDSPCVFPRRGTRWS